MFGASITKCTIGLLCRCTISARLMMMGKPSGYDADASTGTIWYWDCVGCHDRIYTASEVNSHFTTSLQERPEWPCHDAKVQRLRTFRANVHHLLICIKQASMCYDCLYKSSSQPMLFSFSNLSYRKHCRYKLNQCSEIWSIPLSTTTEIETNAVA